MTLFVQCKLWRKAIAFGVVIRCVLTFEQSCCCGRFDIRVSSTWKKDCGVMFDLSMRFRYLHLMITKPIQADLQILEKPAVNNVSTL